MRIKSLIKIMNLNEDLLNVFTDYAFSLDHYFKDDKNKEEHKVLYEEYKILNQNLKQIIKRYNS